MKHQPAQGTEPMAERIIPDAGFHSNEVVPPDDAYSEDDRAWFAAHPKRQHRIRPMYPGEWPRELPDPPLGYRHWSIVRELAEGVRVRLSVTLAGEPAKGEAAVEALAGIAVGMREAHRAGGNA